MLQATFGPTAFRVLGNAALYLQFLVYQTVHSGAPATQAYISYVEETGSHATNQMQPDAADPRNEADGGESPGPCQLIRASVS